MDPSEKCETAGLPGYRHLKPVLQAAIVKRDDRSARSFAGDFPAAIHLADGRIGAYPAKAIVPRQVSGQRIEGFHSESVIAQQRQCGAGTDTKAVDLHRSWTHAHVFPQAN